MPRQGENPRKIMRADGWTYWRITFGYWVDPDTGASVPITAAHRKSKIKREYGGATVSDARAMLNKRRCEARAGEYIDPKFQRVQELQQAAERDKQRGPTVDELLPDHIKDQLARNRSDHVVTNWSEDRALYPWFADKRIREITPKMVAEFRDYALRESPRLRRGDVTTGLSASTVRLLIGSLSRLFKWAIERDITDTNPTREIEKPAPPRSKPDPVSPTEWVAILTEARRPKYPQWVADVFQVMLGLGMDVSDVTNLKWSDLGQGRTRIQLKRRKTQQSFTAELSATIRAIFKRQQRRLDSPYIFHGQDGEPLASRVRCKYAARIQRECINAAGVRARAKQLRHSMATWRALAGQEMYEIMGAMGHSSLTMTSHYVQAAHRCGFTVPNMDALWGIVEGRDSRISATVNDTRNDTIGTEALSLGV